MKTKVVIIILTYIGLSACEYPIHNRGVNSKDTTKNYSVLSNKSHLEKDCLDSLSTSITSASSDSLYSLQIMTYSLSNSLATRSHNPCVTGQDLFFKMKDSVIFIEQAPIKEQISDGSKKCQFLKYTISGIAIDSIKTQKVYMLYLFAANGEAEYNFFYNQRGKLLFFQRCDKKGCSIKCYDFDEKAAISYCNDDSRTLNIKDIKGICE